MRRRLVVGLAALGALVGCSPQPAALVGTWEGTAGVGESNLSVRYTFTADGKVSQKGDTPAGKVEGKGTYTVEGDKITLSPPESLVMDGKAQNLPAAARETMRVVGTWKIEGDTLTVTPEGGSAMNLKRVVEKP